MRTCLDRYHTAPGPVVWDQDWSCAGLGVMYSTYLPRLDGSRPRLPLSRPHPRGSMENTDANMVGPRRWRLDSWERWTAPGNPKECD